MKLIECRNQDDIIKVLLLRTKIYNDIENIINENDLYSTLLLAKKANKDVATVTLNIKDGCAQLSNFLIFNTDITKEIILEFIEAITNYCENIALNEITIKIMIDQANPFKECGYVTSSEVFLESDNLYIELTKYLNKL